MEFIELSEEEAVLIIKQNYSKLNESDLEKLRLIGLNISFEKLMEENSNVRI